MSVFSNNLLFAALANSNTGYAITSAALFDGSSGYLSRTPSSAGNRREFEISFWLHPFATGYLFCAGPDISNYFAISIDGNNKLRVQDRVSGTYNLNLETTAVYRDATAPLHITVRIDTTQATASDRATVEVNNEEVTAFTTATYPSQNYDTHWNNNVLHTIANDSFSGGSFMDGIFAETHLTDGVLNGLYVEGAGSSCVPIAYTGSYSTNGSYLKFEDGALGTDSSGNGNNWTVNGTVTAVPNTPTDVVATWNALYDGSATYSNGNRTIDVSAANQATGISTLPLPDKAHFELVVNSPTTQSCRIGASDHSYTSSKRQGLFLDAAGALKKIVDGTETSIGTTWAVNDRFTFEFNTVAKTFSVKKNGTEFISDEAYTTTDQLFVFSRDGSGTTGINITANFSESDFVDTPTAGFKELSAANLPAVSGQLSNHFVQDTDTESNIESAVSTLRSGWSNYVDIYKNRDNIETWAWQFSHDGSNEYAVSTTATRQARRTLSGTDNWWGGSIRIGADYGTAAGSQVHTNGAATTITHNLGEIRGVIMLFPRSNGDVWLHHPELTSGSLLKLNSSATETASTNITNVSANSFDIGSGHATDTYDYLVLTENDFIRLFSYTGNGSADGPFNNLNGSPEFYFTKRTAAAASWVVKDRSRSPNNPMNEYLIFDGTNTEASLGSVPMDGVGVGLKGRDAGTGVNATGETYVGIAFVDPIGSNRMPRGE